MDLRTGSVTEGSPLAQCISGSRRGPTNPFDEFPREALNGSIPDRFEAIVRRYPDRLAVKYRDASVTYDALNRAANQIAHAILAHSPDGDEPVAILLEKGISQIVVLFGVLKAGKIYVPLEPAIPSDRLHTLWEDSQARLILTNSWHLPLARHLAGDQARCLDIGTLHTSLSTENVGLPIAPDAVGHIMYTSGSTGRPKGVMWTHRMILHVAMTRANSLHIGPEDRLTLLFSYSFGASVHCIFGSLLNGAALFPFDLGDDGVANLATWLIEEGITIFTAVPSVFRLFTGSLTGAEEFPRLRVLSVGSDTVSPRDVQLYKTHFPDTCLFLVRLGINEGGILRHFWIDKTMRVDGPMVPVGYPVPDKEIVLLDDDGTTVGEGQIGEIAVRSRYLPPGYWRRPDLTRAFVPDPLGSDLRIYRTGDLGRMVSDGCLHYLGRKDFQVKVRGQQVEVPAIEAALLAVGNIHEVAVIARQEATGEQRLVAYLVPTTRPAPSVTALRRALARTLPDHMIPAAYVVLDALPLTPHGKLDRRALPEPEGLRPQLDAPYSAPRTPLEEALASIWADVLGLDRVGAHDNFLELGGHSLTAAQILARVVTTFRIELPVRSLLEAPTVAAMAVAMVGWLAEGANAGEAARVLREMEGLSDEVAERSLADETQPPAARQTVGARDA